MITASAARTQISILVAISTRGMYAAAMRKDRRGAACRTGASDGKVMLYLCSVRGLSCASSHVHVVLRLASGWVEKWLITGLSIPRLLFSAYQAIAGNSIPCSLSAAPPLLFCSSHGVPGQPSPPSQPSAPPPSVTLVRIRHIGTSD